MNPPCSAEPELWMSDLRADQRIAARLCGDGCPSKRYQECREEGWNHEFGVWGGLAPADRKKADPERYEAGLSKRKELSDEMDRTAKAMAAANEEPKLKGAIPESERQEAPAPMSRSERMHMRWSGTVRTCAVDGCERRAHCRGWCVRHYHRWRATGNPLGKSGKP